MTNERTNETTTGAREVLRAEMKTFGERLAAQARAAHVETTSRAAARFAQNVARAKNRRAAEIRAARAAGLSSIFTNGGRA